MTTAVPLADPEVAVIVAVPLPTAVTKPPDETVATDAADVVHVTAAPGIVAPRESVTVGVSVAVAPIDPSDRLSGERVTEDAT